MFDGAVVEDVLLDTEGGNTVVRLLCSGMPDLPEWSPHYGKVRVSAGAFAGAPEGAVRAARTDGAVRHGQGHTLKVPLRVNAMRSGRLIISTPARITAAPTPAPRSGVHRAAGSPDRAVSAGFT